MQLICPACGTRNRVPEARLEEGPSCGRCHAALLPARPVNLGDDEFPRFLEGSDLPVVVDFWASWCQPCRAMAPAFAEAAAAMPDVLFAKVNVDEAQRAAQRWSVRSIPTLVLAHRGRELARQSGAISASRLGAWIRQHRP